MRFAVHWPQQPGASPRSHGMPCRDVPGRIHISIAREPAGSAREDRLALAVLCRHVPARATALRRVCGANLLYSSWSLVLQSTHQHSPAASEHAPVQSGLLAYSPTRLARRASRGTGHAGDAQVLDADHIETASQVSRGLLDPVLAPIGLADLEPGDGQLHSGASGRPSAGTGQLALQSTQPSLLGMAQGRTVQQPASGQGGADGYASVNTDDLSRARRGEWFGDGCESDMPAPSPIPLHPIGLHAFGYGARPAESYPSGLGNPDLAGFATEPADVVWLNPDDPESFTSPGFAPGRLPVRAGEEISHRLGKVPQRLLLHHLTAIGQPLMLRAGLGQLTALSQISRCCATPRTPPGLLLNGQVPDEPGLRALTSQDRLLRWRRNQAITGHVSNLVASTDIPEEVKGRCLLHPSLRATRLRVS